MLLLSVLEPFITASGVWCACCYTGEAAAGSVAVWDVVCNSAKQMLLFFFLCSRLHLHRSQPVPRRPRRVAEHAEEHRHGTVVGAASHRQQETCNYNY